MFYILKNILDVNTSDIDQTNLEQYLKKKRKTNSSTVTQIQGRTTVHDSVFYSCFHIIFLQNWQLTFIIPQVLYLQTAFFSEEGVFYLFVCFMKYLNLVFLNFAQ